ncbi:AmmeMemoRadiSam system protein A [Acidianus hospitalis]|uniref:Protein DDW13_03980 n=2 Tax=Acidianus hospitalis TaxID=563177 RepID=A0A2T9X7V8_9CREN|nr:AmmeMemoRadiSam system protein A [Acidianus hospitalis]AEE93497.1 AMMECR1 domain protein [Acidianus hospitalis W1]PVU76112.1 AmmeMemoRadiSam system protein A [Acidianus hospitalis]
MSLVTIQELGIEEGKTLVKIARQAIMKKLGLQSSISYKESEVLNKKGLAFVTLETLLGETTTLRGCIGYVEAVAPLKEIVKNAAIAAAFSDPRFPPLMKDEINNIIIEVTVLTKPEEVVVDDRKELPKVIKVGRDGLIVEKGILYSGLLLPQVPMEYCWDEETFLAETCLKAGLSPDCWLDKNVRIKRFEGIIFREKYPNSDEILMIKPSDVKCKPFDFSE